MSDLETGQLPQGGRPVLQCWSGGVDLWVYRWWDTADAYVTGEPPARHKEFRALGAVLAAILADAARCHVVTPMPSQSVISGIMDQDPPNVSPVD